MVDVTDASFQTEVLDRSATVPVVVDLWAEWCAPCKTLGPILETVVAETGGQVALAKVDVDANPALARAFQAQSIPAVHAIVDGKVVDSFIGARPEAEVREFVLRLVAAPEPTEIERLLGAGDEDSLRAALELEPGNEAAVVALAELLVGAGSSQDALELLERVPESPDTRRVAALARTGVAVGDDLGIEAQLGGLLDSVKDDEEARARFVDLLELLGDDDARTGWRRKLSAKLF